MLVFSETDRMKGRPLDVGPPESASGTSEPPPEWQGTSRYEVRRRIGAGGMGAVYEAFDRDGNELVAVKTLLRFSPAALYRFKQEFRTLADVVHPNLVHLRELVVPDADHVFFAMELVTGIDFLAHCVRPGLRPGAGMAPTSRQATTRLLGGFAPGEADITAPFDVADPVPVVRPTARSPADLARLRPALRQLVAGVSALHAAGKLHRDIKPSNVLVTPEGRVVLLDFGVATDLSRVLQESGEREVVGTARYMAPEQATEESPTPASDWYSVGAMLYEVLVGRPPFSGSSMEVLTRKSVVDPPAPSERVADAPADLDTLCCALLRRDPALRPTGPEITRWVEERPGAAGRPSLSTPVPSRVSVTSPLIGRDAQLAVLREALEAASRDRKLVTARVHGSSGMGASALVQRFVADITEQGAVGLLAGRVYERESMPYKALDSVIDALSRQLMRLDDESGGARQSFPLPRDIGALAHLFPVLSRIRRVSDAPAPVTTGPMALRRHAIGALRELLVRLAATRLLVIFIDDVQWGDVDSAAVLADLVRPPFDAPILLVLAYRDMPDEASRFPVETQARWPKESPVYDIPLGALAPPDAVALALALLASDDASARETAEAIARESGGNPLLVEELARDVVRPRRSRDSLAPAASAAIAPPEVVRLESVIEARMAKLPADARRLLELVAVSARPLPLSLVGDAAGIYERLEDTVAALRARRFVRSGFRDGREVVEMVHDRVRQTIVTQLTPDALKGHHHRLARVLEPVPGVDTESLALHLLGAGENARAAAYAERAADQAATKLAFDQAIRLYKLAIEMLGDASAEARRVRVRLAQALERAARGVEAAQVYLVAAERARGFEKMDLEREAAEQLLLSGHLDEGDAALSRILAAAGMRRPRTLLGAVVSWVFYRVLLLLTGSRLSERETRDVRRVDHMRIEALHAVVLGFGLVNVVYGVFLQPRHLFLAFRAGDRFQVLRAAGIEALDEAARGGPEGKREKAFAAIVERMAEKSGDVDSRAFSEGTRALRMFLHGRWREAGDALGDVLARYATTPAGWHANAQLFAVYCLMFRGKLAELRVDHAARLAEAEERRDLYTTVNLRVGHSNSVWLLGDDVEAARRHLREAMAAWSQRGFSLQHYRALLAEANIELYAGNGRRAYDLVTGQWRALKKSFLMHVQYVRADAYFLLARCALATNRVGEAAAFARKLDREAMPWTRTLAALVWAGVARGAGDRDATRAHLRAAVDYADASDMRLHAAVAKLRLGDLDGTSTEAGDRAREWMTGQGIVRPDRVAAMLAPRPDEIE
jgi:serine/threonine protein kinase